MTTDNHIAAPSFDRMRNMLVRAAEVRESEQQQIFDALDDIYARLAPVDSLGAVRKRLSELPDRTEVGVLAERLDEAMTRLESQDNALAALTHAVESIVDKLAKPFAQLDGRLDGMASRFEGVAGRMDGLEDKLQNIHRRLDELGGHLDKQDAKLDSIPQSTQGPVRERIELAESSLRERIETTDQELRSRVDELDRATKERIAGAADSLKTAVTETGEMVDPAERLEKLGGRLDTVTDRLDDLATRLDKVEDGVTGRLGDLDGSLRTGLSKVEGTLAQQPDTDSVDSLVRRSNDESVRRIGGQLDEAMATFAELMLGGGPAVQQIAPPPPAPRQPRRSSRNGRSPKAADAKAKNGSADADDAPAE
ncbi:PA containing protein [Amycolatopsis jiangsuensis]|uniref:Chromosome segregation ATPase n=1 Tax=Amycolatopsis jiangsuensis TaxID=1181879 RepID=A0A840IZI0_9PSEU|nr:PA containing protein [Amycolatopsis jiangsuensis]MBB4686284.1 chromosome segregation ATPase [Amycolatopsis jiangsuensis]